MSEPKSIGFILLEFGEDSDSNRAKERVKRIIKHAEFRKFDKGRLIFGISKSERIRTICWRVPEQGEMPSCDDCEIIKGWFQ